MTYVREETMFLAEPVIESTIVALVLHMHPYIGEVVECFSPPPWWLENQEEMGKNVAYDTIGSGQHQDPSDSHVFYFYLVSDIKNVYLVLCKLS